MGDLLYIPLYGKESLVIATDCSGSVGECKTDDVQVDLTVVSYYMARVALMELLSEEVTIIGYTISNLTKDGWNKINEGINKAINEIGIESLPFIGSSETNFTMKQTGLGITIIGRQIERPSYPEFDKYAVIGSPLVGQEVIERKDEVVTLSQAIALRAFENIGVIIPVGSKGIRWECKEAFSKKIKYCDVDLEKSSGPATCLIINYNKQVESQLRGMFGSNFHEVMI